jgi:uracil-DNA glycosylase
MTKRDGVIQIMKKAFESDNLLDENSEAQFVCECGGAKCKVRKHVDPIMSPIFGEEDTKVMIVAEAPSKRKGTGSKVIVGGQAKDWIDRPGERQISALFSFVREHFHTAPYFTDVVKCGVEKQDRGEKRRLMNRIEQCTKRYLFGEIKVMEPEKILCVGKTSFDTLTKAQASGEVDKQIELKYLLHYGGQAGLTLTVEDKRTVIWPMQIGEKVSQEKLESLIKNKVASDKSEYA